MNFTHYLIPLLIICSPTLTFSQKWQSALVVFESGREVQTEIKFREKVYMGEIPVRIDGKRCVYPLDSIKSLQLGTDRYLRFQLTEIEAQPFVLGKEVGQGLYHAIFKEIQCLCDNSFRMIQAYLVAGDKLYILRKKAFKDEFVEDEDFSRFSYIAEPKLAFTSFPQKFSETIFSE